MKWNVNLQKWISIYLSEPVRGGAEGGSASIWPQRLCSVRVRQIKAQVQGERLRQRCSTAPDPPGSALCYLPVFRHNLHRGGIAYEVSHGATLLSQQKWRISSPGLHTITGVQNELVILCNSHVVMHQASVNTSVNVSQLYCHTA